MKFGETFYQRSVPEWAAFNLNYNAIKDIVKQRTSLNLAGPVSIPQQGKSRWQDSDAALSKLLRDQYDNIALFLRMKQGEIDRRLNVLQKQIAALRNHVDEKALQTDLVASMPGRKYRKLNKETEDLGDLIQKTARFASAQKIAFRKLLKKYTKWTSSTSLQTRMDVEVFSSNQLKTDYSDYLQELAELKTVLTEELAIPMLRRQQVDRLAGQKLQIGSSKTSTRSLIAKINQSVQQASPAFDAAMTVVPYGEAAGSAFYWVHPDNLDEVRALILRNMKRNGSASSTPSRTSSHDSLRSQKSMPASQTSSSPTCMAFYDNAQRYATDTSSARPSRIACSAFWTSDKMAAVTLAGLSPTSSGEQFILLDHEDLSSALDREVEPSDDSVGVSTVQRYLREHRDVKPLASLRAQRTRYSAMNNTADVASWATLDTSINVDSVNVEQLGYIRQPSQSGKSFPYAVLHIRWEFARMPGVVRVFDESHLAYRVYDFTIEDMAIRTAQQDLPEPSWKRLIETDITKLPLPHSPSLNRLKTTSRIRLSASDLSGTSSGPSSSEGKSDSVFSAATRGQSSVTSEETRIAGASSPEETTSTMDNKPRKKRARIVIPEPEPRFRYWNEFDDGDSDVNPQDGYAIYVNPDEPMFPAMSQAWAAIKSSWPLRLVIAEKRPVNERTPLLYDEETASLESSDSDSFVQPQQHQQQMRQGLVWGLVGGISITFVIGMVVLLCMISLA